MTPQAVKLFFCPTDPAVDPRLREPLAIEVREAREGDVIMAAGIADVARWLNVNGYRWATASNGVWVR